MSTNTVKYVDITPTWREILPALLAIFESGDRRTAVDELLKMASLADKYNTIAREMK